MTAQQCLQNRFNITNKDQMDCFNVMQKSNRLTICLPTGAGKGHLMITDLMNRILNTNGQIFAIATHRLMLNTQHMSDLLNDYISLTGKIGYIFVGSMSYNAALIQNSKEQNSMNHSLGLSANAFISSVISSPQLNEKIQEHNDAGRKIVIISTYHSLMKLSSIDIDTIYCDEAHILATNSQKEDAAFKENFEQINAKNYFFFSATPKDLTGLKEGENTDSFLMNNKDIFGDRVGITFATAVGQGYIVEPVVHLVRPSNFVEGDDDFGSLMDKVKFIQEAFYAHKDYMKNKSACPEKLGVKILVKCSSVTDEMWPIFNILKGTLPGVKICAGASVENSESGIYSQGKHCIDNEIIKKRDEYLKRLQGLTDEEEAIVLHFDILSEGINVAGFTGIMFLSGMLLTITKILQNIGRTTRLHVIDRLRLKNKEISVKKYLEWIKPCSAVIIPYWDGKSSDTKRKMATIIHDLRTKYDFNARLEVSLGDDNGSTDGKTPVPISIAEKERENLKNSLIDEVEQEIEGIRVGIYERYEEQRILKLTTHDFFDEVLSSL